MQTRYSEVHSLLAELRKDSIILPKLPGKHFWSRMSEKVIAERSAAIDAIVKQMVKVADKHPAVHNFLRLEIGQQLADQVCTLRSLSSALTRSSVMPLYHLFLNPH